MTTIHISLKKTCLSSFSVALDLLPLSPMKTHASSSKPSVHVYRGAVRWWFTGITSVVRKTRDYHNCTFKGVGPFFVQSLFVKGFPKNGQFTSCVIAETHRHLHATRVQFFCKDSAASHSAH